MVRFAGTEAENITAEAMKKAWEAICNIWQASYALDVHDTEQATYGDEGTDVNVPQNLKEAFRYIVAALEKFTCTIVYDIIGHTYNPLHHELDPADPEAQRYGNQPLSAALCEATVIEVVKPGFRVSGRLSFRTVVRVAVPSTPAGALLSACRATAVHPRRPLPFLVTSSMSAVEVADTGYTASTTSASPLGQQFAVAAIDRAAAATWDDTTASDRAASASAPASVSAEDMDDTNLTDLSLLFNTSAEPDQRDARGKQAAAAAQHSAEGASHEATAYGSAGGCGGISTVSAAGAGGGGGPGAGAEPRHLLERLFKYRLGSGGVPCDATGPPPVLGDGAEVPAESPSAGAAAIAAATAAPQQSGCPAGPPQWWPAPAFDLLQPGVEGFFGGSGIGSGGHPAPFTVANPSAFGRAHVQLFPPFGAPLQPMPDPTMGLRIVTKMPTKDATASLPYGDANGSPAARLGGVGSPGTLAGSGSPGALARHASGSPLSSPAVPVLLALERAGTGPFSTAAWRSGQDDGNIGGQAASGGVQGRTSIDQSAVHLQPPMPPSPPPLAPAVADHAVPGPSFQPTSAGPVSNGGMNPPVAAGSAGTSNGSGGPQGVSGSNGANGASDVSGAKLARAAGVSKIAANAAAVAAAAVKRAAAAKAMTTAARRGAAAAPRPQTGPRAPPLSGPAAAPHVDGSTAGAAPAPPAAPPPAVAASGAGGAPQQPGAASTSAGAAPAACVPGPSDLRPNPAAAPSSAGPNLNTAAARPEPSGGRRTAVWPECQPQSQPQSQAPNGVTAPAHPAPTVQPAFAADPSLPPAVQPHPYAGFSGGGRISAEAPARYGQHPAWADSNGGVRFAEDLEEAHDRRPAPQRSKSAPRPARPSMPAGRQTQPPYQGPARGRPGPGPGPYPWTGESSEKAQAYGGYGQRQPGPGPRHPAAGYAQQPTPHPLSYRWGDQGPQPFYRPPPSYYEKYKQKRGEPVHDQQPDRTGQDMPYDPCPQYPAREHYERCPRRSDVQRQQAASSSQSASSQRTASSTGSASDLPAPPASAARASSAAEKRRQQPGSAGDAASTSADTDGDGDSGSARLDADGVDGGDEYGHAHEYVAEPYGGAGGPGWGRGGRGGFVPRGRGRGGRRGGGRGNWGYGGRGGRMGGGYAVSGYEARVQ